MKKKQTNQLQARYLNERLTAAYRAQRYATIEHTEPANIKAARAIIKNWDKQARKRRDRLREDWHRVLEKKYSAAKEALLFKSPSEALQAVQQFEIDVKTLGKAANSR